MNRSPQEPQNSTPARFLLISLCMVSALRAPLVCALAASLGACGLIMPSEDKDKVARACAGEPVEGTKAHEKNGKGFMVFVQEEADGPYEYSANGVHIGLRNTAKLEEVNTVFCMAAPVEVPQGVCAFDTAEGLGVAGVQMVETSRSAGPSFPRIGVHRAARMVDPATGETITQTVIEVSGGECDAAIIGDPEAAYFRASPPSGISYADWATSQLGVEK